MVHINDNYLKLKSGYLFPEIARRVQAFALAHPQAHIIRLGIGDVTQALPAVAVQAAHEAFAEMAKEETFRGYGPEQGYDFLRAAIHEHDYSARGVNLDLDEIFISDGAKCDTANMQEIFSPECRVAVSDPVYPVYADTNIMAGRHITFLPCLAENDFIPSVTKKKLDLIYLCFPNNPTGAMITKHALKKWVDYARAHESIILYDVAYRAYIADPDLPHSIYEVDGAKTCAIEFNSFSKSAGFTGTRCAYTVVPSLLKGRDKKGQEININSLWHRRQTTKFNGVSYPSQRAAQACYSVEGRAQVHKLIAYYRQNATTILSGLKKLSLPAYGGIHAPYIWFKVPKGYDSWGFFDALLTKAHVVGSPGAGFGSRGEGFFRLSAFGRHQDVAEAMQRLINTCF